MKVAKTTLKIVSWMAIVVGVLFVIFGVYAMVNYPEIADAFANIDFGQNDPKTVASLAFIFVAAFCFLYAYLLRNAIKDGKKTTLLLVLIGLGIISTLLTIVKDFTVTSLISLLINGFVLYQVIVLRKAANN